jgi:hypothetical protein
MNRETANAILTFVLSLIYTAWCFAGCPIQV